jgi:hypothetical protein
VTSREDAEALLAGTGVVMPPGRYAFTDGNAKGGVGIVSVTQGLTGTVESAKEICTSVGEVFAAAPIQGLESPTQIANELAKTRNILAEMAAFYRALLDIPAGTSFTVVHDYKGVASWMQGHWNRDGGSVLGGVIAECLALIEKKQLELTFRHQPGHGSTWAGRNDFVSWNRRADELATAGCRPADE